MPRIDVDIEIESFDISKAAKEKLQDIYIETLGDFFYYDYKIQYLKDNLEQCFDEVLEKVINLHQLPLEKAYIENEYEKINFVTLDDIISKKVKYQSLDQSDLLELLTKELNTKDKDIIISIENLDIKISNIEDYEIINYYLKIEGTDEEKIKLARILSSKIDKTFNAAYFSNYDYRIDAIFDDQIKNSDYEDEISNGNYIRFLADGYNYDSMSDYYLLRYLYHRFQDDKIKDIFFKKIKSYGNRYNKLLLSIFDIDFNYTHSLIKDEIVQFLADENDDIKEKEITQFILENKTEILKFSGILKEELLFELADSIGKNGSIGYCIVVITKALFDIGLDVNTKIQDEYFLEYCFNSWVMYSHSTIYEDSDYDSDSSHHDLMNIIFSHHPNLDFWDTIKDKKVPFIFNYFEYFVHLEKGYLGSGLNSRYVKINPQGYVTVVEILFNQNKHYALTLGKPLSIHNQYDCMSMTKELIDVTVISMPYQITALEYKQLVKVKNNIIFLHPKYLNEKDNLQIQKNNKSSSTNQNINLIDTKLIKAAKDNNIEKIKEYISLGANVNVKSRYFLDDVPLLNIVIHKKNFDAFEFLISNSQIDIYQTDEIGETCFHVAINKCDTRFIDALLTLGFDFSHIFHKFGDSIDFTYKEYLEERCTELYSNYFNDNIKITEEKLILALLKKEDRKIDYLIKDIKINSKKTFIEILFMHESNSFNNIDSLIENNKELTQLNKILILILSIYKNDLKMIKKLIHEISIINRHVPISELYGFNFRYVNTYTNNQMTLFQIAVLSGKNEIVDYLHGLGGDYSIVDSTNRNALFYCHDSYQLIKMLDLNIPMNIIDVEGKNATRYLSTKGMQSDSAVEARKKYQIFIVMLEKGIDIIPSIGDNFLFYAFSYRLIDVIMYFNNESLQNKIHTKLIDIIIQEDYFYEEKLKMLEELINSGLDIHFLISKGKSIYQSLVKKKKNKFVLELLNKYDNKGLGKVKSIETLKVVKVKINEKNVILTYGCKEKIKSHEIVKVPYGKENTIFDGVAVEDSYEINKDDLDFDVNKLKYIYK